MQNNVADINHFIEEEDIISLSKIKLQSEKSEKLRRGFITHLHEQKWCQSLTNWLNIGGNLIKEMYS